MLLKAKVFPAAKRTTVTRKTADRFEILVKAKAERGAANAEAKRALAEYLGISTQKVRLIRGATRPNKLFSV